MNTIRRIGGVTLALMALVSFEAVAQSAAEILNRMISEYGKNTEGVKNYTLVQDIMGMESITYFEKEIVDGHPVFRLRQTQAGGMVMTEMHEDEGAWDDFYAFAPRFVDRASYKGRDEVDGNAVHVVVVDGLNEIDFGPGTAQQDADFEAKRGTFYVDTDEWMVRRMVFDGTLLQDGKRHDVTSTMDLQDFRTVNGMVHPFRMVMRMEGLGEVMDPEMRQQLEEMKRELEQMPEAQRKMVEQMMKGQMERIEQMGAGGEGTITMEIRVKELRVNSGPPKGN